MFNKEDNSLAVTIVGSVSSWEGPTVASDPVSKADSSAYYTLSDHFIRYSYTPAY